MNEYIKTYSNGTQEYYRDKEKTILHREDGPAIELASGSKLWYQNHKRHRMNGPAVEHADGSKSWCINDVLIFTIGNSGEIVNRMQ